MRPVRHRRFATNGTPNSLQATVMKDFSPGLQIRPRRFDSGFGLHIRKPRRLTSAGFFCGRDLVDHFRNFLNRFRNPKFLMWDCSTLHAKAALVLLHSLWESYLDGIMPIWQLKELA